MNKAQLIERVRELHGNQLTAEQAVEAVLDTVVREVAAGGNVAVTGFGTLDAMPVAARYVRNPATGEKLWMLATHRVRFRAGQSFTELAAGDRELPETGSAIKKAPRGSLTRS